MARLHRRDLRPGAVGRAGGHLDEAIELVNANPYGNGTAIFTRDGGAARRFQREVEVGMVGINVPIPVPMAYYSFGGWKESLFGDAHIHGTEGVRFYTRGKSVTTRWPEPDRADAGRRDRPALPVGRRRVTARPVTAKDRPVAVQAGRWLEPPTGSLVGVSPPPFVPPVSARSTSTVRCTWPTTADPTAALSWSVSTVSAAVT